MILTDHWYLFLFDTFIQPRLHREKFNKLNVYPCELDALHITGERTSGCQVKPRYAISSPFARSCVGTYYSVMLSRPCRPLAWRWCSKRQNENVDKTLTILGGCRLTCKYTDDLIDIPIPKVDRRSKTALEKRKNK